MTNEIKEILEYIKKWMGLSEIPMIVKLEDYITNLQEENKQLREENKRIFANVNDDQLLRSNAMNWAEAQDYKQRIDKAIEYIEKYVSVYDMEGDLRERLLNILKGEE